MISKKNCLKRLKNSVYVIIDPDICVKSPVYTALQAIKGGAAVIQLRYKTLNDNKFFKLAGSLKRLCAGGNALFFVNDRADIAAMVKADGLHLGQWDLPVAAARKIFKGVVGVSTHNMAEVKKAVKDKADYIGFGPVYKTTTKKGLPPVVGLNRLKKISGKILLPAVAIGGINENNSGEVFSSGACSVAVISAVCASKDPLKAVKNILRNRR